MAELEEVYVVLVDRMEVELERLIEPMLFELMVLYVEFFSCSC